MRNLIKILLCVCFLPQGMSAQGILERKEPKVVMKSGPYVGIQSGRFYAAEIGWEHQRVKSTRLLQSNTMAFHAGINASFDFKHLNPILGLDAGFWQRESAIGFTYGLNACVRTNFSSNRVGVCPTIGLKILQLHVQTGYHLLFPFNINYQTFDTNTFFISAKYVLIKKKNRK